MPKWFKDAIFFFAIIFLLSPFAFAKDVTVFDVRRPLAMDNDDISPKDYYINAGAVDGLKPGILITVNRRLSLYDAYQNKSPGELVVAVGTLRIIHVQSEVSVARLEKNQSSDKTPTVDFDTVMVGDRVDLSSARAAPQKTASLTPAPNKSGTDTPSDAPENADFSSSLPQPTITQSQPL